MNCDTARRMMETNDPALARHLQSCPSCIVSTQARYYEAPPALQQKIGQSLRHESSTRVPWRWLAIAASLLLVVSAVWNLVLLRSHVDPRQLIAETVLSAHLRSLTGTHLLDVPSTDRHTVKPWFAGKLDFSPPVKEIADFPLLGGRIEYFDGHPAAALVYGHGAHIVNLFVWPSTTTTDTAQTRSGYHLRSWSSGGMAFWAISDISDAELGQFVSRYRQDL